MIESIKFWFAKPLGDLMFSAMVLLCMAAAFVVTIVVMGLVRAWKQRNRLRPQPKRFYEE